MTTRRATGVGMLAVVLFSAVVTLVRVTSQDFGATLGAPLIYTLASTVLWLTHRPRGLRRFPLRYLLVCGALFVVYETSLALAVGLADSAEQTLEVSVVNYLWPTFLVLLSLVGRRSGRVHWLVIPGVALATLGTAAVVGGREGLNVAAIAGHVVSNPVPYALTFGGAVVWAVYSVLTPRLAEGCDGLTVFITGTAAALWIVHLTTGTSADRAPGVGGWAVLVAAALVIGAGYACWNIGILRGNITLLGTASYAAPILSSLIGAVVLGAALTPSFWWGVLLVAVGSAMSGWATRQMET